MNALLAQVDVRDERDIVTARQRAQVVAARLGFEALDQARIATAVSEIARNAVQYARGGRVEFSVEGDSSQVMAIRVADNGPGIDEFLSPADASDESTPGVLHGLAGARRLMDGFALESSIGSGTVVTMAKLLPRRLAVITPAVAARIAEEMARLDPPSPIEALIRQNQELLRALDDLRLRELEMVRLNRELADTNRGVMALYLELDSKAESLKLASEMKTRFLSNVSHELRTPLSSILSLSRLMLDKTDGELTAEHERQAGFILRAAQELTTLVNDLLDLARIEAGREVLRVDEVDLPGLFAALRGMLKPIIKKDSAVELIFDDPSTLPSMTTDEGKLAQILRNLLSNALKFTERGEVRVSARLDAEETVVFTVTDTGIGIHSSNLERAFEEFGQVDGPLQRKVKGTGLGLPLSRKMAMLLGGRLEVESEPGVGSTFSLTLPIHHPDHPARPPAPIAESKEGLHGP